ncbi:hypothetical protein GobsT_57820 [Gemmata obscuriglobus]|uniref:DUF1501 domain-containing protein n=1 Tax=Gemmata obscuriglobus TaxID=114 RepID=A0A2Z3GQ53_9BACT|nr:DUF1501 domain-containing protein [Gemmata obscuriglobus]AWM36419.1 DUF1501 domain-containing protein [Gemmata obscuriglobus]QEG30964.1 hypothetical protein GobsT_57820 [Gemmata obscuriglobus]VTS10297.1 secreted protein containing duf1501 : Uncharacterized protein OS=Pirellula staleyi (strain ATCC 27377 / DSM 6068 / ICPB 4128) GN=Psta_3102 PE=4 SV=1: DUF1501 [Gemmata obscuriglobus UQM 2246]
MRPNLTALATRREMLRSTALGFGWLALADLLATESRAAETGRSGRPDPLALKKPHFEPKAKRVIFLFMHGGPSQVDTFDYKPKLAEHDGKPLPFAKPRVVSGPTGNLLKSPFAFKQYGQSGAWVSELFPHIGSKADELCFIKSMHGSNSRHGGALLELHTGSDTFVRPSMGSWVTYGLGTENRDLPGYLTICPTLSHGGVNNYSSAFLPAAYQATPLGSAGAPINQVTVPFVKGTTPAAQQRLELDLLAGLESERAGGADAATDGRLQSFEMAFRMQNTAPAVQDLSKESAETLKLYGIDDKVTESFGRQCLMARRYSEAGVRFVQCSHSYKWDQHENLKKDHTSNAREVDKPIAGLLTDLKARGLLKDTLVIWAGEFGRTPVAQGKDGRDHNPHAFTIFLAGGGVKAGFSLGATDEYGYYATEDKVHIHDLHATILHLLGLNHEKLTYKHAGRDFRLTDVHGNVVKEIIA